jgi:hypothetical protein
MFSHLCVCASVNLIMNTAKAKRMRTICRFMLENMVKAVPEWLGVVRSTVGDNKLSGALTCVCL